MKEKLQVKLLYATIAPLVMLGMISVIISVFQLNKYINNEVHIELRNAAATVSISLDHIYSGEYCEITKDGHSTLCKGAYEINGRIQYFDDLKEKTGLEYSLCFYDRRMATTLQDDNQSFLVGTYINENIYSAINQDAVYCENSVINNQNYFTYYTPIKDADGKMIGVLGIGKIAEEVRNRLMATAIPIIIITSAITLISGLLIFLFARKLTSHIEEIRKFVKHIANGEFNKRISDSVYLRDDELGEIGQDIVVMRNTLRDLIEIDALTKLYNRRTGEKKLAGVNSKKLHHKINSYAFAIGDIDFFKKVNDTYGHEAGDEVLKTIAGIIKKNMKKHGFVARWGGEEFMIIFEGKSMNEAASVLEDILQQIRNTTITYNNDAIKVTMTFGVVNGSTEKTPEELFALADQKLYFGKENGRNQVVTTRKNK